MRRHAAVGLAGVVASALMAAGCGTPHSHEVGTRHGGYSLEQDGKRIVVRSLADQWPTLHRALTSLHPSLEPIGAPHFEIGRVAVIDRDFWGRERHWPRSAIRNIALERRRIRGGESKRPATERPWRVRILDAEGSPLRPAFGFRHEVDARSFRSALRAFLDLEDPPLTSPDTSI